MNRGLNGGPARGHGDVLASRDAQLVALAHHEVGEAVDGLSRGLIFTLCGSPGYTKGLGLSVGCDITVTAGFSGVGTGCPGMRMAGWLLTERKV